MSDRMTRRLQGRLQSVAVIGAPADEVWREIVNVDIAAVHQPSYFRLAGIPHPLRAEVESEGIGGRRVAYFANGKRFLQVITGWEPPRAYSFQFNPEAGFRVLYVFDLSDGAVQIPSGDYLIVPDGDGVRLTLGTQYSVDRRFFFLVPPVLLFLKLFQRYLLSSISANVRAAHSRDGQE